MIYNSDSLIDKYLDSATVVRFIDDLTAANKRFNLYSRNLNRLDLRRLIGESLVALEIGIITADSGPILDIGSGWGIPALPWLIALPQLQVTFLERSRKKADFIALSLNRLGLRGESNPADLASFSLAPPEHKYRLFSSRQVRIGAREIKQIKKLAAPQSSLILINPPLEAIEIFDDFQTELIEYRIDDQPSKNIAIIALS